MRAHLHEDMAEYWAVVGSLYSADPVSAVWRCSKVP
ncbi:Probable acetyltransferase [Mycobacteroides abscessus subsp. abscessus]|nr:Probable acetyltransferase [Mycobacteroides abscessus subsp. abscessus]